MLADRALVDKATVDTAMVCYGVLEPEIEEYNSSNDGSERSFERADQQQQQHSQQSSSNSQDAATSFSQQSNSGSWSSQDEPGRVSQELLAYKKRMEKWEGEWKEAIEEEKREFEEEIERRDREYRTMGFDSREEEMEFRKYREKERRKSLL